MPAPPGARNTPSNHHTVPETSCNKGKPIDVNCQIFSRMFLQVHREFLKIFFASSS